MSEQIELYSAEEHRRSMPVQKPGRSKQDYGTPIELMVAIQKRWGAISWDLAASDSNHKAPKYITEEMNSLQINWHELDGLLFLNPPFSDIAPWAEKCKEESALGARIILLTPASVGSNWFREHVYPCAHIVALNPRLTFEGCTTAYPKDCSLAVYNGGNTGFSIWRWK